LKKGKDRIPHFTKHQDGRVMLMAGLWDCVILEGKTEPLWTFAVVTTSANKEFSWLHDRQPVILSSREALNIWLDTTSQKWTSELTRLVEPYHDLNAPLQCYQVPKEIGKVGAESPTFIEPIANRKDGIQAMFSKQRQSEKSGVKRKRRSSPSEAMKTSSMGFTPAKKVKRIDGQSLDDDRDDFGSLDHTLTSPSNLESLASLSNSKATLTK
jgi:hypothetical protein